MRYNKKEMEGSRADEAAYFSGMKATVIRMENNFRLCQEVSYGIILTNI